MQDMLEVQFRRISIKGSLVSVPPDEDVLASATIACPLKQAIGCKGKISFPPLIVGRVSGSRFRQFSADDILNHYTNQHARTSFRSCLECGSVVAMTDKIGVRLSQEAIEWWKQQQTTAEEQGVSL